MLPQERKYVNRDVSVGKTLEHVGVEPDILVLPTSQDLANKRDPALAKAAGLGRRERAVAYFIPAWCTALPFFSLRSRHRTVSRISGIQFLPNSRVSLLGRDLMSARAMHFGDILSSVDEIRALTFIA